MVIVPLQSSADRDRARAFVAEQVSKGLPGLSENKHALLDGPAGHPGRGLMAVSGTEVVGYVGLSPTQEAEEWAIEVLGARTDVEALVGEAVRAVVDEGAVALRWWTYAADLEDYPPRLGFQPERDLVVMSRPLPIDDAPQFPSGIEVRGFRPGDEPAWVEVNNAAFAGHPENGGLSVADMRRRMSLSWFDPEGLRMAWQDTNLAGFCWTKVHPEGDGEIYIIAVAPDSQGLGLGKSLVLEGMRHLAEVGCPRVILYTEGDNKAARGLYTATGMKVEKVHRSFIRHLDSE